MIKTPFLQREINRDEARTLVQKGLKELGLKANDVPALKSALVSSSALRSRTNDAVVYPDIKL